MIELGNRDFVDGAVRIVYQDEVGRQFVYDDEGERAYGVWLAPEADEPVVVARQ